MPDDKTRDHRGQPTGATPPAQPDAGSSGPVVRDHRGGQGPVGRPPTNPLAGVGFGGLDGAVVRDHRGQPGGGDPVVRDHRESKIKHVFVLMLENRSFDHMLGFSGITGTDATTGAPTSIDGLKGTEQFPFAGAFYKVSTGAPDTMSNGPAHDFKDALEQLCGAAAGFQSLGTYPLINNSGFVTSYARVDANNPGGALKCFSPEQVPVLTALAREFVVCDRWFSSMPGPTEPNRFFVHAGTAGHFDDSPSGTDQGLSSILPGSGFSFSHGTIFKKLNDAGVPFRIYAGDDFPNVSELEGVSIVWDVDDYEDFSEDVGSSDYDAAYTFIEPSYDAIHGHFEDGNSQHPRGSVAAGERFIKETYEAIRKSPKWNESMLVILWDEHGGFFDHVPPGPSRATGSVGQTHGFLFDRLGPRVPAVIVSPLVPRNLIEHRVLDHCAIPATLERLFKLAPLTERVSLTSGFNDLATLATARTDAPMTLPPSAAGSMARMLRIPLAAKEARTPNASLVDGPAGNITWLLRATAAQHMEVVPASERPAVEARAAAVKTHGELLTYQKEVHALVMAARVHHNVVRSAVVRRAPVATGDVRVPVAAAIADAAPV
jgi:phospholipase C